MRAGVRDTTYVSFAPESTAYTNVPDCVFAAMSEGRTERGHTLPALVPLFDSAVVASSTPPRLVAVAATTAPAVTQEA